VDLTDTNENAKTSTKPLPILPQTVPVIDNTATYVTKHKTNTTTTMGADPKPKNLTLPTDGIHLNK
jgi:hypothetical protein